MTIQNFYKDVLKALLHEVNDEDLISFRRPTSSNRRLSPATVDSHRLVLPTKERLSEGLGEGYMAFHPLSENIARRGVSPVQAYLQRVARSILGYQYLTLAQSLLEVAADNSLHQDLPPSCNEFLKSVPEADKKSVKAFSQLLEAASRRKNAVITLYLKNGGSLQGEDYNRLCIIRVPLLDELETAKSEGRKRVYGVELRKKDVATFEALLRHLMPMGDDPETYSAGSNSNLAPYFEAFLRAYGNAAQQLNKMVNRYREAFGLELEPLDLAYLEQIEQIGQYHNKIPPQPGNEGGVAKNEEASGEGAVAPTAETPPWSDAPSQPPTAAAPQQRPTSPHHRPSSPAPAPSNNNSDTMTWQEWQEAMRSGGPGAVPGMGQGYPGGQMGGGPVPYPQPNRPVPPEMAWMYQNQYAGQPQQQNPFAQAFAMARGGGQPAPTQGPMGPGGGYQPNQGPYGGGNAGGGGPSLL